VREGGREGGRGEGEGFAAIHPLRIPAFSRLRSSSTCVPHRGGKFWEGCLCLIKGSNTDEGVAQDKVFARTANRIRGLGAIAQYAIH